jgi:hypothetical protein
MSPGVIRDHNSNLLSSRDSFVNYSAVRHGSVIRRGSNLINMPHPNANVESALQYFRNEKVGNALMQSQVNNLFYANLMTQFTEDPVQPNFDIDTMSPERQEEYQKDLQLIEDAYLEESKKLEMTYWDKKKQLYLQYETNNDENSG